MNLAYAFLASAGEYMPDGRLFLFGGDIDGIQVRRFPAEIAGLCLVFKLLLTEEERTDRHAIMADVLSPGGESICPFGMVQLGPLERTKAADPGASVGIVFNMVRFTVSKEGRYTIRLTAGDRELSQLPLDVSVAPER
jgi:hypothetical protein